jgi:protein TonB
MSGAFLLALAVHGALFLVAAVTTFRTVAASRREDTRLELRQAVATQDSRLSGVTFESLLAPHAHFELAEVEPPEPELPLTLAPEMLAFPHAQQATESTQPERAGSARSYAVLRRGGRGAHGVGSGNQSGDAAGSSGAGEADGEGVPSARPKVASEGRAQEATKIVVATSSRVVALEAPPPAYPRLSLRAGEEGSVLCRLSISALGQVSSVEILESSGHARLDEAARGALLQWRFEPRRDAGLAVATTLEHRVIFRLDPP